MKEANFQEFQETVSQFTIRHKSILDILSKTQEAAAHVNRAVIKAVTDCGCLEIHTEKKDLPQNLRLEDLCSFMDSHLNGSICPECKDYVETELGKLLFYVTALCNTLELDLDQVLAKERNKLTTLRYFNLT